MGLQRVEGGFKSADFFPQLLDLLTIVAVNKCEIMSLIYPSPVVSVPFVFLKYIYSEQ